GSGDAFLLLVGRPEVAPDRDVDDRVAGLLVLAAPDRAADFDLFSGPATGALLPLVRNLVAGIDVEVAAERAAQAVGYLRAPGDHLELAARAHGLVEVLLGHLQQVVDGDLDRLPVLRLVLVHLGACGSRKPQANRKRSEGPPHEPSIGKKGHRYPAYFVGGAVARQRPVRARDATLLVTGLT